MVHEMPSGQAGEALATTDIPIDQPTPLAGGEAFGQTEPTQEIRRRPPARLPLLATLVVFASLPPARELPSPHPGVKERIMQKFSKDKPTGAPEPSNR